MPFCINTVHDLSMIILVTDVLFVTGYKHRRIRLNEFLSLICYLDLATSVSGKTVEQKPSNSDGRLIREGYCFRNGQQTVLFFLVFLVKDHSNLHQWCATLPPLQDLCRSLQHFYTQREQMYKTNSFST